MDLTTLTVVQALRGLRAREFSSAELTAAYLDRIARLDGDLRAYLTVTADLAMAQAAEADRRRASGEDAPLLGIPMALKDLALTKGIRTTCASKILDNFVPLEDATLTTRLYEAGAVLLGKTNMDEFAMGSSTENSGYFPTRNPWGDLDRVPGGSSGGSAAATAGRLAAFAIGSDTGGSIRQPASLCGIVGFKPTYGRVSRYGMVAFASSLDQFGPLTRDVADAALVTRVIAGHDARDSTSLDVAVPDYPAALRMDLRGLKIGVPREYFVAGMETGVESSVRAALDVLRDLGAELGEVAMPHTGYGVAAYYIIAPAEASANLARYDGVKYGYSADDADSMWDSYYKTRGRGFGAEVKRRILIGTYALSSGYYDAYYLKAQKIRTLIKQDFDQAFERFDAIVAPTSPTVAFKIGEKVDDPVAMYLNDVCTIPVNLAGLPGLSMPCGLSEGLPVGLQIIGPQLGEQVVLDVAHAYEQAAALELRADFGDARVPPPVGGG